MGATDEQRDAAIIVWVVPGSPLPENRPVKPNRVPVQVPPGNPGNCVWVNVKEVIFPSMVPERVKKRVPKVFDPVTWKEEPEITY